MDEDQLDQPDTEQEVHVVELGVHATMKLSDGTIVAVQTPPLTPEHDQLTVDSVRAHIMQLGVDATRALAKSLGGRQPSGIVVPRAGGLGGLRVHGQ